MYFIKTPSIIQHLVPSIVWKLKSIKTVYLTFDDGPHPEITNFVLKTLKEHGAKGTFFCLGEQVEKHPKLLERIIEEGHSVGNHTYSHYDGWKTPTSAYLEDIKKGHTLIKSPLFRPPYGRIGISQKKAIQKDYKIVMWDILSGDFDSTISSDKLLQNVIKNVEDGSIIVFHDNPSAASKLKEVLPLVLQFFSEANIKCQKIEADLL